ncbi:MAG: cation diffusion facilitator family transporter [Chloroflexi bacterium]|nr:cation diffusion facilitator family transporter [Chloroflexota bacterium]
MSREDKHASVRRVLWTVLVANLLITVVKIVLGLFSGALAVVADGFHSLVDSSSNLVGLAAVGLAQRPADEDHAYGHQRYETLGALAIGALLLAAAWEIGRAILERLAGDPAPDVSTLTLVIMALTLPVNLLVVVMERRAGQRLNSAILLADAQHTQTDLYVTVSVLFSLIGVWLGLPWLDVVVASGVVILILRAAFGLLRDTTRSLSDAIVADPGKVEQIARTVPGVRFVHNVRSRGTPDAGFVDLHVKVDPSMNTGQAHAVASEVERRIKDELDHIVDALVHIEPTRLQESTRWERMAYDIRQITDAMGLGYHDLHIHADMDGELSLELHLEMPVDISLGEAHQLADQFEERFGARWPQIQHIISHLEPLPEKVLLPSEERDSSYNERIRDVLQQVVEEANILEIKSFQSKGHLSAAIKLRLPAGLSLIEAHARSEKLETMLLDRIEELDRVTLHIEPEQSSVSP